MKYITALSVFLILIIFDVLIGLTILLPIVLVDERPAWPYSVGFAREIWFEKTR